MITAPPPRARYVLKHVLVNLLSLLVKGIEAPDSRVSHWCRAYVLGKGSLRY